LLDKFCGSEHTFPDQDVELGETSVVHFIPLRDRVECLLILPDPHLQVFDLLFVVVSLLSVIYVPLLHGDSEATGDGSEGRCVNVLVSIEECECGAGRDRWSECDGGREHGARVLARWNGKGCSVVPCSGFIHGGLNGEVVRGVGHDFWGVV
jgi:hypothetical protein